MADSRKWMHRVELAVTIGAFVLVGAGFLMSTLFGS